MTFKQFTETQGRINDASGVTGQLFVQVRQELDRGYR
jgi:hypothetical protein